MLRCRLTIVVTAMTWSGSVAWRIPRKKPRAMMENKVTIYSQTAAAELERRMRRLLKTPDIRPAFPRPWQIIEIGHSRLHRLDVAFYGCFNILRQTARSDFGMAATSAPLKIVGC